MTVARVLPSCAAVVAVAGATVVAVSMGRAANAPDAPYSLPSLAASAVPMPSWPPRRGAPATSTAPVSQPVPTAQSAARQTPNATHRVAPRPAGSRTTHVAPANSSPPAITPAPRSAPKPAPQRGQRLPVAGSTTAATRVITVSAAASWSTTATLQAWVRAPGGGWLKHGSAILAHVGADGVSTAASESRSATPVGSFSLTQAFGAYPDPGTALPYFRTNSADWWISQSGPLYNTHQHCGSGCGFTLGDPNEHLSAILPYYRYSVVIDYNTRNAPGGVRPGRGSAFFLHVTDGRATAGCIAIPQADLVAIMKWLTPAAHPRILIGVS
ncbi:MAG: hypothetical protein DLM58_03325 [Pseudonocardiales bacterium]|nr:MAG: hypothetical protein DLM58_03325 [Pseudonocardiales bacterium]